MEASVLILATVMWEMRRYSQALYCEGTTMSLWAPCVCCLTIVWLFQSDLHHDS